MKSKTDLWVEMSIREIWTQCHFAEIAYSNIDPKAQRATDLVFSSIHSFLSHCAMVSKMLKARKENDSILKSFVLRLGMVSILLKFGKNNNSISIGQILSISSGSLVHKRKFRNSLEHYDRELKKWIKKYPTTINIGTYNIGSKRSIRGGNMVFVSHYDPVTDNFTFVDEDFNLMELVNEISRIKKIANKWVKGMQFGKIKPPFIQG